jgi:hypothetical protein
MISLRNVAISVFGNALSAPPTCSQDLSRYREFQLGTSLPAVASDGEKLISDRSEKVIARWEDSQYSFNFFQ